MNRWLPIGGGLLLLAAAGALHGWVVNRWGQSDEPARSAARLASVPKLFGDWEAAGDDRIISERELRIGEIAGYLSRDYRHRRTGELITILIVCGRPGPIAVHTPDVCYRGQGFEMVNKTREQLSTSEPTAADEYIAGKFRRPGAAVPEHLRILWTWSAGQGWKAPDAAGWSGSPRFVFAGEPALFKLYVIRRLPTGEEPLANDPAVDFLRELLPVLQQTLFSPSENQGAGPG